MRNTTASIKPEKNKKISIIIPCAGIGSRMKSYGPKSLLSIRDGISILDNQLKNIYKYIHNPQITIVTGFGSDKIKEIYSGIKNINIAYNQEWESNNVTSSIRLGINKSKYNNILLIYGDLVFNAWTLKVPLSSYSMILVDKYGLMKDEEVGCIYNSNILEQMMYDLPNKWAQIAYFTNNESKILKNILSTDQYDKCFGFEIINKIIHQGGKFAVNSPKRMRITDIDSSKDLNKIDQIL